MKHETQITRQGIICVSLCLALLLCGALMSVSAQTGKESEGAKHKHATSARKGRLPRAATGERDPFNKYRVVVKKSLKNVPSPVSLPSIQARIEHYRSQKMIAMNMQQPAPKPTTALLLGEMQVIGIFRTPRGYAAMVEATPIKLSYTIYPGERFYDGQLVAIEEDRLVFRRETRWTDGHLERAVETKPLRHANVVADPLAAAAAKENSSSGTAPGDSAGKAENRLAAPEKQ